MALYRQRGCAPFCGERKGHEWTTLSLFSTQSGETVRMAEQVYGRAAGETETVSYGMFERTYALSGCTFARVGYRPEWVFDPAEIASITIFEQTFPLDGLVPVES